MSYPTKIATCCYCGTRAALVLSGKTRHELACSSCGAPLHDLKMLRKDASGDRDLVSKSRIRSKPADPIRGYKWDKPKKAKKGKRRKSMFRWALEEAFDVIEDIFD